MNGGTVYMTVRIPRSFYLLPNSITFPTSHPDRLAKSNSSPSRGAGCQGLVNSAIWDGQEEKGARLRSQSNTAPRQEDPVSLPISAAQQYTLRPIHLSATLHDLNLPSVIAIDPLRPCAPVCSNYTPTWLWIPGARMETRCPGFREAYDVCKACFRDGTRVKRADGQWGGKRGVLEGECKTLD